VKAFDWVRNYSLQWDITSSLKFNYSANAGARLMEPQGLIDTKEKRDSIWRSFGKGGRMNFFDQRFDFTYQIPINKIPLFAWLTGNFRYAGQYKFMGAPISIDYLGHTIDNSNQIQLSGQVNMQTLYNYIPYLKKVNSASPQQATRATPAKPAEQPAKGRKNRAEKDSLKTGPNYGKIIGDGTLRFLMMVRTVNLSWSQGKGTLLPGFIHTPDLFGINFANNAPGFLFVFGGQPDIKTMAMNGDWISKSEDLNAAFQKRFNQTINFRAQVEPFKEFRIDVIANRVYANNNTSYIKIGEDGKIDEFSKSYNGNFNITYVALGTMFKKSEDVFNEFRDIRLKIANLLASTNQYSTGVDSGGVFPIGYNALSQDVLLHSFMATYMGKNPDKMKMNKPFLTVPLPNWQLRYSGLTKMKSMAKVFQNFSINHNYACTYSIGNYRSNLNFNKEEAGETDLMGNFYPENEIAQISLMENFNPLIGFDMTLTNSMMINVQYKRSRNLSLSFANNQITEMLSNDLSISAGYRFKDLKIGISIAGSKRQVVSDLAITLGFSMRDNTTVLRKINEDVNQISAGMLNFTIDATADYQVSSLIGLQLYYKHLINKPYISTQYQNANIEAGLRIRLMLTQ
jgi:cell surface protein SprA